MEKIEITKTLLRGGLNTKPLRNRIQQYNKSLIKDETDFKTLSKSFKKLSKRLRQRDKKNDFEELKELEKRGFF